jgi:hypothetical protein
MEKGMIRGGINPNKYTGDNRYQPLDYRENPKRCPWCNTPLVFPRRWCNAKCLRLFRYYKVEKIKNL